LTGKLGLLGTSGLVSLPLCLESFLFILLVSILDESKSLAAVHLDLPSDVIGFFALAFASWPFVEIEECLNHVIVFDFLVRVF